MKEAEQLNDEFFERVKTQIEELGFQENNDYQNFYTLSSIKEIAFNNLQNEVALLNNSLTWLYDKIDKIAQIEQACILKDQLLEKKCLNMQRYITKQTIHLLADGKKVALAGAGFHSCKLLELLNGELEICCIIAKESKYDFDSIPVYTYTEFSKGMADIVIISSYIYRYDIKTELRKLPFRTTIIDLYDELENKGLPLNREFWLL